MHCTTSITMPMQAHQLKTFLPDIRSRMLQTQTTRNLHKQLSMPSGTPVHTSVHSLTGVTYLPRIHQRNQSQVGQPFPIRPEVSSRLSMVNQLNHEMRQADRKVQEKELSTRVFTGDSIPSKANLLQRGMLQGRAFRLPALGSTKTIESTPSTPDPKNSLSLMCQRAESRKSTEPSEQDDCDGSVETRNTSSSLSIEPYPFSEDDDDLEKDIEDLTSPDVKNVKLIEAKKRKRPKKIAPKPKLPDPEPIKVKKKKAKRRSWKDIRPVKDLTPLAPTAYEKELEKLLPERKSFFYSGSIERELQRHIPARIPGGRLKPVYRRSADGEIYLPKHPLDIKCHHLIDGSTPKEDGETKALTRRPGEDLPSFNERKRRWVLKEEIQKNSTIVSFKEYSYNT